MCDARAGMCAFRDPALKSVWRAQSLPGPASEDPTERGWSQREHSRPQEDARIVNYRRARVRDAYPRAVGARVASEGPESAKC